MIPMAMTVATLTVVNLTVATLTVATRLILNPIKSVFHVNKQSVYHVLCQRKRRQVSQRRPILKRRKVLKRIRMILIISGERQHKVEYNYAINII